MTPVGEDTAPAEILREIEVSASLEDSSSSQTHNEPMTGETKASEEKETELSTTEPTSETNAILASVEDIKNAVERSWDFSNRKVIVHNVMKFMKSKETTKMVSQWMTAIREQFPGTAMEYEKIKKPPQDTFVVVTLKEESMCQVLIDYIHDSQVKNKRGFLLVAKPGTEGEDTNNNNSNKRNASTDGDAEDASAPTSKRQRIIEESVSAARRPVTEEEIKNKVTPLWQLTEEQQRNKKMTNMIKGCAMKIVASVKKRFRYVFVCMIW